MSRFTRALEGALRSEGISQAEAAGTAGIHPSTVSRLMKGEMDNSVEYVERLIQALPKEADRQHCLREWLFDQTPQKYWDQLTVHFGPAVHEAAPRPLNDSLTEALNTLEEASTDDVDLAQLVRKLAKVVGPTRKRGSGRKSSAAETPPHSGSTPPLPPRENAS